MFLTNINIYIYFAFQPQKSWEAIIATNTIFNFI